MTACGVIGVGAIGRGFVERLVATGHPVSAFDVDSECAARAAAAGAAVAASPREVAEQAQVILLTLPDTPEILAVLPGETGLEAGLRPGSIVVVASTVAPETPVELERRLAPLGVQVVDAPISGGPARAAAGTLAIMAGGSPEAVAACVPVLERLGRVVHVGPVGHGEITKLVNNLMGAVIVLGISEGLTLAAKAGADVERVCEAVGAGSGSSWILREWIPDTVFRGDYRRRFSLDLMRKDMGLISELTERLGVDTPALELAAQTFEQAIAAGHGASDFSVVVALHAAAAGAQLPAGPPGR
jgi:3-hydroxyisobutyrate dehydrogenase-like beta-hydroxyacid dehydrogenase